MQSKFNTINKQSFAKVRTKLGNFFFFGLKMSLTEQVLLSGLLEALCLFLVHLQVKDKDKFFRALQDKFISIF